MTNPAYNRYMASEAWKAKRLQVLERDGWQCMTCDCIHEGRYTKADLEVHHRHYRNFENEPLEDLISICRECHDAITAVHRRRRYSVKQLPKNVFEDVVSRKVIPHGSNDSDLPPQGHCPDHSAQRSHGQPARSVVEETQGNLRETEESGLGLRGNGTDRMVRFLVSRQKRKDYPTGDAC